MYDKYTREGEIYCSSAQYIHSFRPTRCIKWVAINQPGNVLGLQSVPCFREPKDVLQSPSSWGQGHCSGKWLCPKIKPRGSKLNPRNNSKTVFTLLNGPGPAPRNTLLTKALQEVSAWWLHGGSLLSPLSSPRRAGTPLTRGIILPWQEQDLCHQENFITKMRTLPHDLFFFLTWINDPGLKFIDVKLLWLCSHLPNICTKTTLALCTWLPQVFTCNVDAHAS